jgi:hypothetical protein
MWVLYLLAVAAVAAVVVVLLGARRRRARNQAGFEPDSPGDEAPALEYEVKRAEAAKASQTAEFYSHLAAEQEARAEELSEESAEAAERAGLEDVRARHPELDAGEPSRD